jgi:hypothetical protein
MALAAGRVHRLRIVNIRTEFLTALSLRDGDAPATWRVVAKDGATIPPARVRDVPAELLFAPARTVRRDARTGRGPLGPRPVRHRSPIAELSR